MLDDYTSYKGVQKKKKKTLYDYANGTPTNWDGQHLPNFENGKVWQNVKERGNLNGKHGFPDLLTKKKKLSRKVRITLI